MKIADSVRVSLAATMMCTIAATNMVPSIAHAEEKATVETAAAQDGDATAGTEKRKYFLDYLFPDRQRAADAEAEADKATATKTKVRSERRERSASGRAGRFRADIARFARAEGVPVDVAEAVVHVESNFNPRARGRAGEIGLMQIKPATARGLGFKGPTSALYDPETNLKWGMRYLAMAYELADGDTCGAILRYNAGHAAKRMTRQARTYCSKVNRYVASLEPSRA